MASSDSSGSRKTMENMKLQSVDGVNYIDFGFDLNLKKTLQLMRDLEIRDDDVICVGYPRCGNHWVFEITSMILRQETTFQSRLIYSTNMELTLEKLSDKIEKMASPRYLGTHHRVHHLPLQAVEKRVKLLYLSRNPKDVYVSLYRMLSNFKDPTYTFNGSWDEFFELHLAGEIPWGPWFEYTLAMDKFMKEHPECPVHIVSFEKLKENPVKEIKDLCSFLGKPDDLADEIAKVTEFNNMKTTLTQGKMQRENQLMKEGSDALIRKGDIGGWKNCFTDAQSERFDKIFNEKMKGCKLADLVSDYL